ncbi:MAG: ABC-2 family transporter protein [Planctomycetota bacterium]
MSPSLFFHLVALEAKKLMSYRVDFWVTMVVNLGVNLIILWALWSAIFAESGAEIIGGWDFPGILSYGVLVFLTGRIVRGGDLQMAIATEIYDGALSRFLLYPRHYTFIKYAQQIGHVMPDLFQSILMGIIAIPLLGLSTTASVTPMTIAMAIPTIMVAHLLFFLMGLIPQYVAFWADNVWSLSVMLRFVTMLLGGAMLPLSLYPDPVQNILQNLPFVYLFEFPTFVLMGKVEPAQWITGIGTCLLWCIIIGAMGIPVWRRGDLRYTGVGI